MYESYFSKISDRLKAAPIAEIEERDIRLWIVKEYLPTHPKGDALKKMLQLFRQIFRYGMSQNLCIKNVAEYISEEDYLKDCDMSCRTDEEKHFPKRKSLFSVRML